MNMKPILFSGPMVRAILDGRKTMTRRVLKPQPLSMDDKIDAVLRFRCGDLLWVRESLKFNSEDYVCYAADMTPIPLIPEGVKAFHRNSVPSIHMPRWACRITLRVTAVKVERLQNISEEDAKAEGILQAETLFGDILYSGTFWAHPVPREYLQHHPQEAFCDLWISINGPDSWDANPWVAAYSFERVT